jgi:hypothetical protein
MILQLGVIVAIFSDQLLHLLTHGLPKLNFARKLCHHDPPGTTYPETKTDKQITHPE